MKLNNKSASEILKESFHKYCLNYWGEFDGYEDISYPEDFDKLLEFCKKEKDYYFFTDIVKDKILYKLNIYEDTIGIDYDTITYLYVFKIEDFYIGISMDTNYNYDIEDELDRFSTAIDDAYFVESYTTIKYKKI